MPKKKKGKGRNIGDSEKRQLILAGDMQEYAKVMRCLGDRRLTVILTDSSEMLAVIPGRFRKRVWIKPDDIVIVSRREFQNNKLDIIHKYNSDEIRKLHKIGDIPDFFLDGDAESTQNNDNGFTIRNDDSDDDETKFDFEDI